MHAPTTGTISPSPARSPTDGPAVIESRFGSVEIRPQGSLRFPAGLCGFVHLHEFGLAEFPDDRFARFKILQSLEDHAISFLVLPEPGLLADADIEKVCGHLSIARSDLVILLMVTVRQTANGAELSVNLRAPLFVDSERHVAFQYVLPNSHYAIRHRL